MRSLLLAVAFLPSTVAAQRVGWDYAKVVSEINDGTTGVNNMLTATKRAQSALRQDGAMEPNTPFAGNLSAALSRSLQTVRGIDCKGRIEGPAQYSPVTIQTADGLAARRKDLSLVTNHAVFHAAVARKARVARDHLKILANHAGAVGDAARAVGDALASKSVRYIQAFQDQAGYASLDFQTIFVPLLSQIQNESEMKSQACGRMAIGAATWLRNTRQSLHSRLAEEGRSLLQIASGGTQEGDTSGSVDVAADFLTTQRILNDAKAQRSAITQRDTELYRQFASARTEWEAFDVTRVPRSDAELDAQQARIGLLDTNLRKKSKELDDYRSSTKARRGQLDSRIVSGDARLRALKEEINKIGSAQKLKVTASRLIDENNADLAALTGTIGAEVE